jgi:hypothetical protein
MRTWRPCSFRAEQPHKNPPIGAFFRAFLAESARQCLSFALKYRHAGDAA